jgi:hypothetical protein
MTYTPFPRTSKGWTIDQWKSYQQAAGDDAVDNIIKLVESYDRQDPAWITIATLEQIKAQWDAIPRDVGEHAILKEY